MLYKMTKLAQKPNYKPKNGKQSDDESESETDDTADEEISSKDAVEGKYERLRDGKVLMIDQVWLWTVDKGISLLPHARGNRSRLSSDHHHLFPLCKIPPPQTLFI